MVKHQHGSAERRSDAAPHPLLGAQQQKAQGLTPGTSGLGIFPPAWLCATLPGCLIGHGTITSKTKNVWVSKLMALIVRPL